jgi:hypothetical protein
MSQKRDRWGLCRAVQIRKDVRGNPFLDRLKVVQTPLFGIYIHVIYRPDADPDPHDHPWPFLSLVLAGEYREHIWSDPSKRGGWRLRIHSRFCLRMVKRSQAHLITDVQRPVWTLCLVGRNHHDWRFWTQDGPVHWRTYLGIPEEVQ